MDAGRYSRMNSVFCVQEGRGKGGNCIIVERKRGHPSREGSRVWMKRREYAKFGSCLHGGDHVGRAGQEDKSKSRVQPRKTKNWDVQMVAT